MDQTGACVILLPTTTFTFPSSAIAAPSLRHHVGVITATHVRTGCGALQSSSEVWSLDHPRVYGPHHDLIQWHGPKNPASPKDDSLSTHHCAIAVPSPYHQCTITVLSLQAHPVSIMDAGLIWYGTITVPASTVRAIADCRCAITALSLPRHYRWGESVWYGGKEYKGSNPRLAQVRSWYR